MAPGGVTLLAHRFTSARATEALNALSGSDLLAQGCVNLISLEAVRTLTGDRWDRKQELVWAFTDRRLEERLAPQDMVHRVSDTDYVIAISAEHATAAQAVCLKVLEEVLLHFMGEVRQGDIVIRRVDSIAEGELTCSDVDVTRIPRLDADTGQGARAMREADFKEADRTPILLRSISGRSLRLDYSTIAVTSLRHGVLAALLIRRQVTDTETGDLLEVDGLDSLTDSDLARIDAATLNYAGLFVLSSADSQVALVLPVSYRSLASRRGREALVAAGAGRPNFRTGAVFELIDLAQGTPQSKIAEVIALGRTMGRSVFARAPHDMRDFATLAGAGLAAITVDMPGLRRNSRMTGVSLATLVERMGKVARTRIAMNPGDTDDDALLAILEFSHVARSQG